MAVNNRIFYAIQEVGIAPNGTAGANSFTSSHLIHGLQSVGLNTKFNLEQVFEIGQLEIYENIENLPDVEITMEKVLDGYCPIYLLATNGAASTTLAGRSTQKCVVGLSIFGDTQDAASGTPISEVMLSGQFLQTLDYTIPVEGNTTESVTLIGNNKVWRTGTGYFFPGRHTNTDAPLSPYGVSRRQDIIFGTGANACNLPYGGGGIPGVNQTGPYAGKLVALSDGSFPAHLQSIKVSTNLGREALNELGRRGPYYRFVSFPTEVKCDIECYSTIGDLVDATEDGVLGSGNNLSNQAIYIQLNEGLKLNLGSRNKLQSVNYGGANAGTRGGNATATYSYSNYNSLSVQHPQDITVALAG